MTISALLCDPLYSIQLLAFGARIERFAALWQIPLRLREIEPDDYHKDFVPLLQQLSTVGQALFSRKLYGLWSPFIAGVAEPGGRGDSRVFPFAPD